MFKNIKNLFVALTVLILGWGCSSDLGNYNYNEINEVKVSGLEESYTVFASDNLKINPVLSPTMDDNKDPNRYSYSWVAMNKAFNPYFKEVIGTSKNFDDIIRLLPKAYDVHYYVKDNVTGVTWDKVFTLNVVTSIYEGWLVLGDVSGTARLDMVSVLANQPTKVIYDVLDKTGSALKLTGNAVDVEIFSSPLLPPSTETVGIYVTTTGNGTARIQQDTFAWQLSQNLSYECVGGNFSTNFGVDFMEPIFTGGANLIYSKGNIYYYYRTGQIRYGLPQNRVEGENNDFVAAPFIAERGVTGNAATSLFYDQTKKRFLRHDTANGICKPMPAYSPTTSLFDFNNTGKELVYMTSSRYNNYEVFAVLKDVALNKFYLTRISLGNVQSYYKEILLAPDFAKAEKFAVSPDWGYLFYSVGGKLYEYDSGLQKAKLMLDKGTENITYLDFNERSKNPKDLVVCSYTGTTGKLELYSVPPVNGDLVKLNSFDGFGKIVKVAYRRR